MPVVAEQIELRTHDEDKVIRMSRVEKSLHGDFCVCRLFVRSGGFVCEKRFEFESPQRALAILRRLDTGELGEASIGNMYDPEFISISHVGQGHVLVKGELIEWAEVPQTLKFAFCTDQTVLRPLIRDFETILNA